MRLPIEDVEEIVIDDDETERKFIIELEEEDIYGNI
jgi:hypothetical protein